MSVFNVLGDNKLGLKSLGARLGWIGATLLTLIAMTGANAATLGEAVDATDLTWTTGGDASWFHQTVETQDGSDAAQSGDIDDSQVTWMQTQVTGPGTLLFWWKVSSEDGRDYLKFYVDGSELDTVVGIAGYTDWTQKMVLLSNGVHTLKWEYSKDGGSADQPDCGWVDQVIWSSLPYYAVTASASPPEWGETTGSASYISNATCTVTAIANTGYTFTNWLEGATEVATTTNYAFTVVSNRTLKAKFTPKLYTISTTANSAEGGTTSGDGTQYYNSSCTAIATPNTGYVFEKWTEGGIQVSTASHYTFTVSSNRVLVANFALADFLIETSSNPIGGGTVSGGGGKAYDSSCTLTATPNAGYTFANWTDAGNVVATSSSYAFTVESNRTLVANFTPAKYTVSTSVSPALGGTASGGGLLDYESSCTVVATTNIGYAFTSWTINDSFVSASSSYTFTVTGDTTLVANFADVGMIGDAVDAPSLGWTTDGASPWFYQTGTTHDGIDAAQSTNQAVFAAKSWIETTVTGPGMVSFWCKVEPAGTDKDALSFYDNGGISKFAVENDSGWTNFVYAVPSGSHILKWEFHNQGTTDPGKAWLDEVVWTPFEFTVATSSSPLGGGILTGSGVFPSNETCTVTATANPGYSFTSWTEGGTFLASTNHYTFMVISNRTLVANFSPINYTIDVSASPTVGGSASGGGAKAFGSSCIVVATPSTGYTFTKWTEGGFEVGTALSYTFTVAGSRTLVAHFTPINYMIDTSSSPSGSGTTSGGGLKAYDGSCTVAATPDPGYAFANWTEGANVVSSTNIYTFTVKGARTLVANFTPRSYTISTSANPMAGGSTSGGGAKAFGSSCTVVATTNPWYTFANWTEGTNVLSTSPDYTFVVEGTRALVAHFTPFDFTITTSSSPVAGGTTSGGGIKAYDALCTVVATPNPGFSFANWKEGASVVTSTTNYMFVVTTNRTLVANFVYTGKLGDAVDAPELIWTTGGTAGYPSTGATTNWFAQTATTHDGVDAAQSGVIGDGGTSWMQTTVTGPGNLSFWWKVDTLDPGDVLRFYVDSIEQSGAIGGQVDWNQKSYSIPAGTHTLKWVYSKDFLGTFPPDCAWVDQVVWTGGAATNLMPIHRFWSDQFGAHFYIMGDSERDRIAAKYPGIWRYEAVAWYAYIVQVAGTEPVHRFWSDRLGKHFYIMGDSERDRIVAKYPGIWRYEAVAWYAYPTQVAGSEPVGRFWSDQFMGHFYIITQSEITRITNKYPGVWNFETNAYYAFTSPSGDARGLARRDPVASPQAKNGFGEVALAVGGSSFAREVSADVSESEADDSGNTILQVTPVSGYGDLVFPLSYPGRDVSAYGYDSATDQWTGVLALTNSQTVATFRGILPDRSYQLEVFVDDPAAAGGQVRVHRSSFEMQFDAPDQLTDPPATAMEDGIGSPMVRIRTPETDGTLTLKLYSSSRGTVQTLPQVMGGETLELVLPEGNCWYWISGWRDADNELVVSLWLRHETPE